MTKGQAIANAKTTRAQLDDILQRMKAHLKELVRVSRGPVTAEEADMSNTIGEAIAQHTLSMRALEEAIMRQGLVLRNIGTAEPYPASKISTEDLAGMLYTAYFKRTDGKSAVTGNPIPDWSRLNELCATGDDRMKLVREGWLAVAETHPTMLRVDPPAGVQL